MEKMIFVNQKMYLNTLKEIREFQKITYYYRNKFVVIPSTLYIPFFTSQNYIVGCQNISDENGFPHTGETSAKSLSDIGVKYVIIGHAEMRKKYPYIDIAKKIENALENNLKIVYCVGEIEEDKIDIIDKELEIIKPNDNIIVSYEPVWAIGTNKTPSIDKINMIATHIKSKGFKKVMYGGSVSEENIERLNTVENIDGFLIGGATVNPKSIIKMIEVVSE